MAKKLFPEHELYLLDNWNDAIELEDSIDSIREKCRGLLDSVLKQVRREHKDFDCQGFYFKYPAAYTWNIGVGKKAWRSSEPKWPSGFWLGDLYVENLVSEDENYPSVNVYIAPEKNTLDLANAKNTIEKEARKLPTLTPEQIAGIEVESKKECFWVTWPLKKSRSELFDLLRSDEAKGFVDCLVEHFEEMMPFIPVIDEIFQVSKKSLS